MQQRYTVAAPDGRRSRVWVLKATKSDVFLMVRTAGGLYKVSFHRPTAQRSTEICQLSIDKRFYDALPLQRRHPSGTRHRMRWTSGVPDAHGFSLAARQYFPASGLLHRRDDLAAKTRRIILPTRAGGIEIGLYFVSDTVTGWPVGVPENAPFVHWPLPNGEVFLALPRLVNPSEGEEADLNVRRHQLRHGTPEWSTGSINHRDSRLGRILYGSQPDGSFLIAELGLS